MQKTMKSRQSGFTLIELIVVIVILGILAATALPKFADLGADARTATVNGAKGAIGATSAMVHGKYLINSSAPISVEGQAVATASGYPAVTNLGAAAGLDKDYSQTITGTAGSGASIRFTPNGLDTAKAATCNVTYTEATGTTTVVPPSVLVTTTGC